jgi:hypothetical protein
MNQKTEEKPKPVIIDGQHVHYFYIRDEERQIVSLVGWHRMDTDAVCVALATCNPNTITKMVRRKDLGPNIFEKKKSRDNFTRQRAHDVANKKLRRGNVMILPYTNQPISTILISISEHHRLERVRKAAKTTLGWFADRAS